MNLNQILSQIASQGIRLSAEGEQLKISAPKGTLTPEIRELISQNKAELLQLLQNVSTIDSSEALSETLTPYEETSPYPPLSLNEQSLWFVWHLAPESYAYNVSFAGRIPEASNISVWQEVFEHLLKQHPGLQTSFPSLNNKPYRKILETPILDLQVTDAISWSVAEVRQRLIASHREPFDLENGPLMRVRFFQQGAQGLTFIVSAHHIVCDGWSLNLMVEELPVIYHQLQTQESISLAPPSHSYPTFVHWQQELLESARGKQLWEYWQQKLEGNLPVLQLPTDYPRPSIQTYKGDSCVFSLSPELTQKLKKLADSRKVSLYALLLTAYQVLLYRYTLQEDIIVGSPVTGRSRSEFNGIMGHFVNMLPMRSNIQGTASFTELLAQVQATVLEALDSQDFPFALMVERLHPQRDLSYSQIMQTNFIFQKFAQIDVLIASTEETPKNWGGLSFIPYSPVLFEGQSDLDLEMSEINSRLEGAFKYNTDLFKQNTIERIIGHFQTLLEGIVAAPQQPVSHLPLLTAAEQQQILVDWNDTAVDYPHDKCIHQLFEEQVENNQNAIAVVFEQQKLTYQQLNSKANQLAHYLQKLGVGPEVLVGICAERSVEMVVGLLAILKAGGAYVPLDPNHPTSRLNYMIEDAQFSILLTQQKWQHNLSQTIEYLICLDRYEEIINQQSQQNLDHQVTVNQLAYVIYTSGSTGKPKGVTIPHQGLLNLVFWHQRTFAIKSSDRASQIAGVGFDASVLEIWPYLSAGACLHLVDSQTCLSPEALRNWLVSEKIKISFVPTPLLENLCSLEWPPETELKTVVTGGDKLHKFPSSALPFYVFNDYGPTENTVVTTSGLVVSDRGGSISPSIGKPISNTKVYILDTNLQPVPIGVVGELYIGGDGLARGYLHRPELTQEKFIPNPFENSKAKSQKSKLYKTGDLARYLSDGNIEFIGRIDHQVKIRGFRIELGEIESVLNTHPQIQQVVVIAREDIAHTKRLLAYIVIDEHESIATSQLRKFMKSKLPEYMIPSAFITLDRLPLTPNGKVNRKALPEPDETITREHEYVAPRTPVEEIIANIFSDILGVQNVGISDNFFELGGHSLLATQLISRLKVALEVEVPLSCVFESPTVGQLEETITQLRNHVKTRTQQQQTSVYTTPSTQPLMEENFLEFKGNQIGLCSWGFPDNPIVLCIHGILDQGLAWQEVALPLATQGYRVVAPDLFGHGRSSHLELVTSYSPLTFLAQIDQVIQELP
ncbi:non-ribosomal peptide synthetase, partial [Okeania sp. KiyG1]|uniref:non-ribosomal peptide synthetase n=1 Tax=Okeania sp. KiyG1 TaxID=2720165 RepID=UPI001920A2F3